MAAAPDDEATLWRTPGGPQSVVDQVTETVLAMVLEGVLAPGEEVAIQDLSGRLGVSHVPVREALRRLESRGLVIFRRGRRPQVAPISVDDFDEVFRIRRLLEADAAERSARLFTDSRIEALNAMAAEFRTALTRERSRILVPSLHANLHFALLPGASAWDRQILEQLWDASERYIQLFVKHSSTSRDGIERIIDDHDRLVAAAGTTTPKQFRKIVVDHIDMSIDALRPMILEIMTVAA
jgi:DNA-binding GntR family transcriptional regulator